jgi:hypothetical protein
VKHTPGPWEVWTYGEPKVVNSEIGWTIYTISNPKPEEEATHWANARLASAAPDLLEALTETWRVLRAAGLLNLVNGVQLGPTSWYIKISDAERLSDAAIAKAEGRS